MRTWKPLLLTLTIAAAAWAPATASAAFQHVVAQGETLSSVAAADGLSVAQLAAANGMSSDSQLVSGSLLVIPPQDASAGESAASAPSTGTSDDSSSSASSGGGVYQVQPGDTLSAIASRMGVSIDSLAAANGLSPSGLLISGTTLHAVGGAGMSAATPTVSSEGSGYVVQPGDTLSSIASRLGVSVDALAAVNGLSPTGLLISGTTLHSTGSSSAADSSAAPATTEMVSTSPSSAGGAQPTSQMMSSSEIGSIASSEGVPASLAEAIGYQESGFNNGMVSSTGAVGVMQIMPSTWNWIGQHLAGPPPLSTSSATDNVRAGSLLLHSLLSDTGGNEAMAVAGYYQGLDSVRAHGLYPDTQAYVNNVMALRQRFGG